MLGLVTAICDIVGSVLIFPHYRGSLDCSATTDNPLCQDSYRSVYLFAFALAIYGLVSNALVFLYRIVLCIQWCNARQGRAGYTEVQASQVTH